MVELSQHDMITLHPTASHLMKTGLGFAFEVHIFGNCLQILSSQQVHIQMQWDMLHLSSTDRCHGDSGVRCCTMGGPWSGGSQTPRCVIITCLSSAIDRT